MTKYIFITGGVISGLGKGIAAASIGRLLESHGYRITIEKLEVKKKRDIFTNVFGLKVAVE